ncbi:MAG TPA: histidine kinase [Ferruginibacter sp.]|nr:histidine kinase [Ferruginibacter sp.]HMP19318.1 histidine kinase [Ferruginibacter sp.]
MKFSLPKYSGKDHLVLAMVLLPVTLLTNVVVFGLRYFTDIYLLLLATAITAIAFSLYFVLCGGIAVVLKSRFPAEQQLNRRMALMIATFLTMSGLFLLLLFRLYTLVPALDYHRDEDSFVWAYFILGITNIFLTFLHEAIARYENWKSNHRETEQLQQAYRKSRLQGLKSQVNPHFLFNSLNSLSGLIAEDEAAAEKFLDEMSKVYRYMLRNDEDDLIPLATELQFTESYIYLLNTRFGSALQISITVSDEDAAKYIPPLSLQTIIENAVSQNTISKLSPLHIRISSGSDGLLEITNNIQPRQITDTADIDSGLDNLVNKYLLMSEQKLYITETYDLRIIQLPLLTKNQEVLL